VIVVKPAVIVLRLAGLVKNPTGAPVRECQERSHCDRSYGGGPVRKFIWQRVGFGASRSFVRREAAGGSPGQGAKR